MYCAQKATLLKECGPSSHLPKVDRSPSIVPGKSKTGEKIRANRSIARLCLQKLLKMIGKPPHVTMENSEAIETKTADSTRDSGLTTATEQNLAQIATPTYAAAFHCIGSVCEDACCGDWDIPVDRGTYEKYQQFPSEKLGSLVSQFVSIRTPSQPDSLYASIHRGPSGLCPFFSADHLCKIQKEYGPHLLSATCSIYPRSLSRVAGELEGSLSLSCPEAARNVLLVPDFMHIKGDLFSGAFRTDNFFHLASDRNSSIPKPHGSYLAIRTLLIDMVRSNT